MRQHGLKSNGEAQGTVVVEEAAVEAAAAEMPAIAPVPVNRGHRKALAGPDKKIVISVSQDQNINAHLKGMVAQLQDMDPEQVRQICPFNGEVISISDFMLAALMQYDLFLNGVQNDAEDAPSIQGFAGSAHEEEYLKRQVALAPKRPRRAAKKAK
jgi:hypothetical protein